jgi:hypothetical protein
MQERFSKRKRKKQGIIHAMTKVKYEKASS